MKRAYGFTIVELLVSIVVIAILVAVSYVTYAHLSDNANKSAAHASSKQVASRLSIEVTRKGAAPTTLASVDIDNSSEVDYQYWFSGKSWCVTTTAGTKSFYASSAKLTPEAGACPGHGSGGVPPVTNFMLNPSFEGGSTGCNWASGNGYTGTVSSDRAFSGNQSFKIVAESTLADRYLQCNPAMTPGTYILSAYVYLTGSGATYGGRQMMFHCATGSCTPQGVEPTYDYTKLNQWQRVSRKVVVNTAATARIRFYTPINSTIYIDGVSVMTAESGYADGDSPGWIWTGTPHASMSTGAAI